MGMEEWLARFKWEYPWEISFTGVPADSPVRTAWKALPTVKELMEAMAAESTEAAMEVEADGQPGQSAQSPQSSQPTQTTQKGWEDLNERRQKQVRLEAAQSL